MSVELCNPAAEMQDSSELEHRRAVCSSRGRSELENDLRQVGELDRVISMVSLIELLW